MRKVAGLASASAANALTLTSPMVWLRAAFAGIGLLLAAEVSFGREIEPLRVGNWSGGAYTDDQSGRFSHCAAAAGYSGGRALHFSVTRDWSWLIGMENPGWRLSKGTHVAITISFDRVGPYQLDGIVIDGTFVKAQLPDDKVAFEAFRSALYLHAYVLGGTQTFSLESSSALFPTLTDCVAAHLRAERPAAKSAQPAVPTPSKPPSNSEADAARDKVLNEAGKQYNDCIDEQMKKIVPYSNEAADVIGQAILTNCSSLEQRYIELSMAMYDATRADVEKAVGPIVEKRKNGLVAEIVTLRAELNRALSSQPNPEVPSTKDTKEQGL